MWDSFAPTRSRRCSGILFTQPHLTQCWQAWKVGGDMAAAGWIRPLADQAIYRAWCQTIVDRVMIETVEGFAPVASGAE